MTDLVERLRKGADDASLDCYAMCEEAAAHIEALEAALREIARQKTTAGELSEEEIEGADFEAAYDVLIDIARKALAPEQDK